MRAFISLELPETIKKEIGETQQKLKETGLQARWVKPEIVHLTLVFLGSITPDKVPIIEQVLAKVSRQIKPIKLKLHQLGCFPNSAKAKIIFIKLSGELEKLNALAIKIRKQLKKENIWFDTKPFNAHLTLARVKKQANLIEVIRKTKIKKTKFIANEVTLTKSQLTNLGPIYHQIKRITLTTQPKPN